MTDSDETIRTAVEMYNNHSANFDEFIEFLSRHSSIGVLGNLARQPPATPEKIAGLLTVLKKHPQSEILMSAYADSTHRREAANPEITETRIRELHSLGEPGVLRELAANPRTPNDLLQQLGNIQNIKFAAQIRRIAQNAKKGKC